MFPHRVSSHPRRSWAQEPKEGYILSLTRFSNVPKLVFENVPLGTTCVRSLIIRNPTAEDIRLFVTRVPRNQCQLDISWYEKVIRSKEDVLLELQWLAEIEGSWRDTILFQDGGLLEKDVPIIFNCVPNKKTNSKCKSKHTVVSSKIRSPLRKKVCPAKKLHQKPLLDIKNLGSTSELLDVGRADESGNKENFFGVPCTTANTTFQISESKLKAPVRDMSSGSEDGFDDRKFNISTSTQSNDSITDVTPPKSTLANSTLSPIGTLEINKWLNGSIIDLTSPDSTITNCTLSPIRTVKINKTSEMGKQQNQEEEVLGDCTSSINRTSTKSPVRDTNSDSGDGFDNGSRVLGGEVHGCCTTFNISTSTQTDDWIIDTTSPERTLTHCTLSPIKTVESNIQPKDIVDGHEEKPLSFL